MSGWDQGSVYVSSNSTKGDEESILPIANHLNPILDLTASQIVTNFSHFIQHFNRDNIFIYKDQLLNNINVKNYSLTISLKDLSRFQEELFSSVTTNPSKVIPLFSRGAREVASKFKSVDSEIQIILNSNQNTIQIRELMAIHVSRLVSVSGIVVAASRKQAKATQIAIMCRNCYSMEKLDCEEGFGGANIPQICNASTNGQGGKKTTLDKCPPDPYVIVPEKCHFVDHQTVKLQEYPESIPTGEMPRQLLLSVQRGLVGKAVPGSRITVIGIYTILNARKKMGKGIHQPYIRVVGIQTENSGRIDVNFSAEEEQEFLTMSRNPEIHKSLLHSIAPSIYGHVDIKKALLCQLFSGSAKYLPDGVRLRGEINILLLGDPGTAKSQMLKFIEKVAPIGVYTSGKGSSAAGLTASVVKDKNSRDFYLEGGAMVLADGGIVCIDEFDKMTSQDRVAIHEAMEQGTISIAKAGITTILNARSSVLAAANPVFGRYDDLKSADDNIDFQTTILSRFDLIFIIKDRLDFAADKKMAEHVFGVHKGVQTEEIETEIPLSKLKRYIAYCRNKCTPRLSDEAAELLNNEYVNMRNLLRGKEAEGQNVPIPITVRQLEAIIRLSESLAKMTLSDTADERHIKEAIRLFKNSTLDAATSGVTANENLSSQSLAEVSSAEKLLKRRLPIGSYISEKQLVEDFVRQGISEFAIRKAISVMVQRTELEYRTQRKQIYRRC